jgi:hypothetical protein
MNNEYYLKNIVELLNGGIKIVKIINRRITKNNAKR